MVKFTSASCPNCGAKLDLKKLDGIIECEYCRKPIVVEKHNGKIKVDGIQTNSEQIDSANKLIELDEFLKAKKIFEECVTKDPDDYQGWYGLLVCRTRNFKIRDNNILFENDINKYYNNYKKTAPEEIIEQHEEQVESYMNPLYQAGKIKDLGIEKIKNLNIKFNWLWVLVIFIILMGISLLANEAFISGILVIASGTIIIPNLRDYVIKISPTKLKITSKYIYITAIVLFIIAIICSPSQ